MRAIIKLTEAEQKDLKRRKKKEQNNKIYRRLIYVEMSSKGMTNLEISSILGVRNDTLTDWKKLYEEGGLEKLSSLNYEGRRKSKLEPYAEEIRKKVKSDFIPTIKSLQSFILKTFNIEVEQSWLSRFCKKNSIYLIKKQD